MEHSQSHDQWLMRVEKGLSAHFKVPNGPSRPGVQWIIGLKRGEVEHSVPVTALFVDNATDETRANQEYPARTAMQYLNDQLRNGWRPEQDKDHTIYIGNPAAQPQNPAPTPKRAKWRLW